MQVPVGIQQCYAACYGSKPKTRIQLREMRADSCTCAMLGKKAAPGWTSTAPKACRQGGSVMQLETKDFFPC